MHCFHHLLEEVTLNMHIALVRMHFLVPMYAYKITPFLEEHLCENYTYLTKMKMVMLRLKIVLV